MAGWRGWRVRVQARLAWLAGEGSRQGWMAKEGCERTGVESKGRMSVMEVGAVERCGWYGEKEKRGYHQSVLC